MRTLQYTLLAKGLVTILNTLNFAEIIRLELSVKRHNSAGWLRTFLSPCSFPSYFLFLCYPNFIGPPPRSSLSPHFLPVLSPISTFPKDVRLCWPFVSMLPQCSHYKTQQIIYESESYFLIMKYDPYLFESEDTLPYS